MSDDPVVLTRSEDALEEFIATIRPLCDMSMVCDITHVDGTKWSAMLIGVSSTSLILEGWDSANHEPSGDPYFLDLCSISEVAVP